jgi:hypothetical protein
MKRKTLLALGIAGAFACSTASAATYLCTQESPGSSSISCAAIPPDVLGSMTSTQDVWVPSPPFVTYYLVPAGQDEVALVEFWQESDPALVTYYYDAGPMASAEIDMSSPAMWSHSEPRSITYLSASESFGTTGTTFGRMDTSG